MSNLPGFNEVGDLPPGIHQAALSTLQQRFGAGSVQRQQLADRLRRVYDLAVGTGCLGRFIVFGSFITATALPNDVDIFLIMDDTFDAGVLTGEAAILFNHAVAQVYLGASVFWVRRSAALDGEQAAIEHWQLKRDGTRRGIVEVVQHDTG